MATQYVVLDTGPKNNATKVVVHTDTPTGNNDVGTVWATALVEATAPVVSEVPVSVMPSGRQAELDAGTRFEWIVNVEYDANIPNAAKLTQLETQIAIDEVVELAEFENRLRFWGRTGSI